MEDNRKIISVRVDPMLHKKLREIALYEDTTLQGYIMNLVKKDLEERERQKG